MPTRRPAALRFDRSEMTASLRAVAAGQQEPFDVLVVGGGITGAGVALDAAHRGLRTALVERDDFASGTSSKSSKLVHGGLRYLQAGDVRLVYQALRERQRLRRNAPHLVETLPFLIPIMTRDGVVSKKLAKALNSALWLYDLTGGWRIGKLHRRLDADAAAAHFPTTRLDRLSGGFVYYDASADDARLTLTVARTAAALGATVLNRATVQSVRRTPDAANGRPDGFAVTMHVDGEALTVPTRAVVNAGGVWADRIGSSTGSIRPAKGVHLTVPWELVQVDVAVIIPARRDKRSLFLVPWGRYPDGTFSHVYIGTTDTDYGGPLDDPPVTDDDVDYVLTALNEALDLERLPPVTVDDVTAVWSGLRPLVDNGGDGSSKTADLSRRHRVDVGDDGVISILGGKLTTYREMAEDTVDVVQRRLGEPRAWWARVDMRRRTVRRRLVGAGPRRDAAAIRTRVGTLDHHLWGRYGTLAAEVHELIADDPELARPLAVGYPYVRAEVVYAVRTEMAMTLHDVLVRRTRLQLFDRQAALDAAPLAADLMASELGWDTTRRDAELAAFHAWSEHEWSTVHVADRFAREPHDAATVAD
ncbi:MAG: glycerol-3-phosphate dehydrogenase/oxidase [Actinomycetota bacterium]